jgi:hypothetical protein
MAGFSKISLVFAATFLILIWVFVGWPRVWENPRVPPEIKETKAETLSLYVDSFDAVDNNWTNVGASPYLDAQDQPTNYIHSTARNKNSGNYGFANTSQTGTINSVYLYIYAYGVTTTDFTTLLSGTDTGLGPPAGSFAWVNVDVSAILTTWDAINAATILFDRPNTANDAGVDAAYLYVDYTPVGNSAPTVSSVNISPSPITLTENGTTTVTVTATITDDNGCDDVFTSGSISAVLYRSGVSGAGSCSANANNCYRGITLTDVGGTCTGGADTQGDASGTVEVWYIAEATDASSTFSGETWQAEVVAADAANATSSATDASPPELNTLLAISVTSSINYGSVNPNATSSTQTVTITNTGNFNSTDANFSGVDLESGGDSIVVTSQRYSTTTLEAWDYMDFTLDGTPTRRELNISKGTATGTPSTQNNYWAIQVPNGTPAGTYNGTTTIEAQ